MKRILLLTIALLIYVSCKRDRSNEKGFVDEKFALENIKIGMTSKEVKEIFGEPKDSLEYYNYEKKVVKIYTYETNNFSDYDFNIVMDKNNIVIEYGFD